MGRVLPNRDEIEDDTPLRLEAAAALAFPHGGMTASGLRRERDRKRLTTAVIAGKEYTTLAAIRDMVNLCRDARQDRACASKKPSATPPVALSGTPHGSSETESVESARAYAKMRLAKLSEGSPPTSSTKPKRAVRGSASVTRLPFRSPT